MTKPSRWIACVAVLPVLFVATGCDKTFDTADLNKEVAKSVKSALGVVKVKCPDDVNAKTGTKAICTATAADGSQTKLQVTVKNGDGDFVVSNAPR